MKKSILSPCALCDADEARKWYEKCEPGLGSEFVRALEEGLSRIETNPELHRVFHAPYRKVLMRRFPFQIVYEVRDDCLWILAVFHAKRDPGQLSKRIEAG